MPGGMFMEHANEKSVGHPPNKWNTVGGVADATLGITPGTVNAITAPAATTALNLTGVGEFANFAGDGLGGIFAAGKLIYDAASFGIAYVAFGK